MDRGAPGALARLAASTDVFVRARRALREQPWGSRNSSSTGRSSPPCSRRSCSSPARSSLRLLPISEYPDVVPPTVVVRAIYPGANPQVIAETVATPLEQAINGVEDMLYMSSQATSDGVMTLTVTFELGTDLDKAQVQVQNRVSQALPKLPEVAAARRHDREGVAGPDDGRAPDLARRPLRHALSRELRHAAREGRARAHRRRRRGARRSAPATTRCASGSIPKRSRR